MASITRSAIGFAKGIGGAIVFAVSAIADPLGAAKMLGIVSQSTAWTLGAVPMRLLFLAIAVGWAFSWYHGVQKQLGGGGREPNMPLYRALRWIARDSVWASKYRWPDEEWVVRVQSEFFSKWHLGRFEMMGIERSGSGALTYLPPVMKGSSECKAEKLVAQEPPTYIWSSVEYGSLEKPRCFFQVRLDREEVMRVWPRRSLLARLLRRSPVERIGDYSEIFAKQDEWYAKNEDFIPGTPMDVILGQRA